MRSPGLPAALLLLAVGACEPSGGARIPTGQDPASVPVRVVDDHAALLVDVHVNGEGPLSFMVDSGSTRSCLDPEVAARLGLEAMAGGSGVDIMGGAGTMRLVPLDSVRVGPATVRDLTACVLDLSHFRDSGLEAWGMLGLDVLTRFRVTLDFEGGRMLLEEP